jgi:hypothetical protein
MSFLRFSTHILNTAWIQSIEIMPQAYKIVLSQPHMSGWFLAGSGRVESDKPLWITEGNSPADFAKLTKWIEQNTSP